VTAALMTVVGIGTKIVPMGAMGALVGALVGVGVVTKIVVRVKELVGIVV